MKYAVVIEKAESNYSAYAPDVPGSIATGDTVEDTIKMMKEALEFHFRGMKKDGDPIPEPSSQCVYIEAETETIVHAA